MSFENFDFNALPNQVYYGQGKIELLPSIIAQQKVFIIASDRQKQVLEALKEKIGADKMTHFAKVTPHVPANLIQEAKKIYLEERCEVILAIGGGSAIGLAKGLALETQTSIIAVPTSYSGSEMTNIWGISQPDSGKTTGRDHRVLPAHVIYDHDFTLSQPKAMAATSAMNAMAHLMEAVYAPNNNPITYITSLYAMKQMMIGMLILSREKQLSANSNNLLLLGAFLGGKALREVSMSLHHKAAHVLGGSFGMEHAPVHTVLQPHVLEYQWSTLGNKLKEDLKAALMNPYPPMALLDAAKVMDAPYTLKQIGFKKENIEQAVDLMLQKPYANPAPLHKEGLTEMMQRAYEGKLLGERK